MDPYLQGYQSYKAGAPRAAPFRFLKRGDDTADLFLSGWDEAMAQGEPRKRKQKLPELSARELERTRQAVYRMKVKPCAGEVK
jgi:hypothetical protein